MANYPYLLFALILVCSNVYAGDIKGVTYSPIEVGQDRTDGIDWDNHISDIPILAEMKVNTIRTYYPITSKRFFQELSNYNIKAIVGIPYIDDRNVEDRYDIANGTYVQYIKEYKDCPALYMVEFGNEYNYHPEWFDGEISNWYRILQEVASKVKILYPQLLVSTAQGGIPPVEVIYQVPSVDVWGFNIYVGKHINGQIRMFLWTINKDIKVYVSETGTDVYNNYTKQADNNKQYEWNDTIFREQEAIDDPRYLGITFMTFSDEWWKEGSPSTHSVDGRSNFPGCCFDGIANEEWFGFVDVKRQRRLTSYIFGE
jgi:hypothetical protein